VDAGKSWAEFKGGEFPSVAVREVQVHPREGDLVIATHGRGLWIVDDLTPLRALTAEVLAKDATFIPGRPVQQRLFADGGWPEGDATFVGENPAGGAAINWYQRSRHLFGPIRIEVLDPAGKVIDTVAATKRRGLNRVSWSMQMKPPRVPRAAQVAFSASQGPRVAPGIYTVRLIKGSQAIETKLEIGLDRRAPFKVADRRQQFDAAMRVHALFGDMSVLVERIQAARAGAEARAKAIPEGDELGRKLRALAGRLDEVKRKIVATKEGGAITGEERIREHADILYGALTVWEGKPAQYQLERIDVLRRELDDVAKEFDSLAATDVRALNQELERRKLEPIPTTVAAVEREAEPGSATALLRCDGALLRLCEAEVSEPAVRR